MSIIGEIGFVTKVDTSGLKSGLATSENEVKKFSGNSEKAFEKIASVAKKALVVAGGAITALTGVAVKSYAEFEQLSGGMRKIFDEIDYSKIAKDAQGAYRTMNISANEYMKQIAGVGATFAATMGDQKGYDTAKRGMQALADYASGTGKSVDLLMDKYQAITRSASGYLSIADQFSGILPQTTDGFLKQAQASGYLSGEYKKLTEVPIDQYQYALTSMIEDGVDKMGLLGNTVAETENTISGSFNAMTASWDNFLVALADPNADVGASVDALVESAVNFVDNVMPAVTESVSSIFGILFERAPILTTIATGLTVLAATVWAVNTAVGAWKATTAALDAVQKILNSTMLPMYAIPALIAGIVTAFVWFFTCTETGQNMIKNFGETVGNVFKGVWDTITGVFSGIVSFFGGIWDGIKQAFGAFASSFGDFVSGIFRGAVNGVLAFIEGFINSPINLLNGFIGIINGVFGVVGVNLGRIDTIRLPRLASGGIVPATRGGQVIMAGEAGEDEWVIPESKMAAVMDKLQKADGGATFNFTFNGIVGTKSELRQCAITFHEAYEEVKKARMTA